MNTYSNYVIGDRLKNTIEKLKGNILESIIYGKFHFVENVYENLHKKTFDLTKKRHIQKFDELIRKNKVIQSAANIADKKNGLLTGLLDN